MRPDPRYTVRIGLFMGWKILPVLYLYFAVAMFFLKKSAPNYKELTREMSRLEVSACGPARKRREAFS